jgi:hypothetical protein
MIRYLESASRVQAVMCLEPLSVARLERGGSAMGLEHGRRGHSIGLTLLIAAAGSLTAGLASAE